MDLDVGESLEQVVCQGTTTQTPDTRFSMVREDEVGGAVRSSHLLKTGEGVNGLDADELCTEVASIVERLLKIAPAVVGLAHRFRRLDHCGDQGSMERSREHRRSTHGAKRRRTAVDEHDDAVGDERHLLARDRVLKLAL